jgi:hypothetical protein
MKLYVKGLLLAALASGAAAAAWKAVGGITGASAAREPQYAYEWSCSMDDAAFVLRDYGGHVGVFASARAESPVTVTDIEVACLRQADQEMLRSGIAVADRDELLTLLEDLGS